VALSRKEFLLLRVLMQNSGHMVARDELFREVWGASDTVEENTLDVTISSLRAKIDGGQPCRLIQTVRGFGYRIRAPKSQ
jgi:DNA-binding response OmpR family regulator